MRLARFFPQLNIPPGLGVSLAPVTAQVTGTSVNPCRQRPGDIARGHVSRIDGDQRPRAGALCRPGADVPAATFRSNRSGQGAVRVTVNADPTIPTVSVGGRVTGLNLAALHLPTDDR